MSIVVEGATDDNQLTDWSETAYEWLQRSIQQQAQEAVVRDPSSAAWSFVRRPNTGVSFIDAALKQRYVSETMIEIRGNERTGKTLTLVTMAARFVVDTHPSRFRSSSTTSSSALPQAVIIDGNQDLVGAQLACTVRSILLRNHEDIAHDNLDSHMSSCLDRIHIVFSGGLPCMGWVSTLEALRLKLSTITDHPTLVLWDGFLSDTSDSVERSEIVRQLTRLIKDCNVFLVITCANNNNWIPGGYEKLISHQVRLETVDRTRESGGHDFVATIRGSETKIPYSLSLGGVLS